MATWIEQRSSSVVARPVSPNQSVSDIEVMQRGHDRLKQDVATMSEKVDSLCLDATQLAVKIPEYKTKIDKLKAELAASSASLQAACADKTEKLFEL